MSSNNSTIGPKKTIFATNFNDPLALQGTPSENDNIKITTGSNVSDNFDTSPTQKILIQLTDIEEGILIDKEGGIVTSEYHNSSPI